MCGICSGPSESTAKVHEVKIHAVDPCSAEIGATKICLADLFGALEVLLAVVVGVEAGAAPLAGDRAAD